MTLSLPSLRLDKSSIELIASLPAGRKTTLTFAPEAGSDRLRKAINKWIPQEAMMEAFESAFRKNWMNLKLYFMIGLPTETLDDVVAIADQVDSINKLGKGLRGRPPRVRISGKQGIHPHAHIGCADNRYFRGRDFNFLSLAVAQARCAQDQTCFIARTIINRLVRRLRQ